MHVPVHSQLICRRSRRPRPLSFLICWRRRPSINPGHFIGVGRFDRPDCHLIAQPTSVDFALFLGFCQPSSFSAPSNHHFPGNAPPMPIFNCHAQLDFHASKCISGAKLQFAIALPFSLLHLRTVRTLVDLHRLMMWRDYPNYVSSFSSHALQSHIRTQADEDLRPCVRYFDVSNFRVEETARCHHEGTVW